MRNTLGDKETHSAVEDGPVRDPHKPVKKLLQRWVEPRRRLSVVSILVFSDILLALMVWLAAFVVQTAFGRFPLSEIPLVTIVPNIVAWIGLRAVLGLYPGYGLDQVEELRRQTFALLATLAIIVVFAFVSKLGQDFSRLYLFTWCLGLLLAAPYVRRWVKWGLRRAGVWP